MSSKTRFLVVGRAGMDFYADPPGTTITDANSFMPALGGSAANTAVALVKQGQSASLLTLLSDDPVGDYVRGQLRHYGVDDHLVLTESSVARTSLAVIETRSEGKGIIYRNVAVDLKLGRQHLDGLNWDDFDVMVTSGTCLAREPSRETTLYLLEQARAHDKVTVMDVDYRAVTWINEEEARTQTLRALDKLDILVGNDVEFDMIAPGNGQAFAKQFAKDHQAIAIYKMGPEGAWTYQPESEAFTPVFKVDALKPTGAGDAFMGGLLTGLASEQPLAEAVRRGAATAAIVVTRPGCAPALPDSAELQEFIDAHPAV